MHFDFWLEMYAFVLTQEVNNTKKEFSQEKSN